MTSDPKPRAGAYFLSFFLSASGLGFFFFSLSRGLLSPMSFTSLAFRDNQQYES